MVASRDPESGGPERSVTIGIPAPAFRMPAAMRLGSVQLQVSDLDRSLAYYQDVLGLRVASRDGDRAELTPHGSEKALIVLSARSGARPVPHAGRLGLYHFAILLPDRATLGQFVAHLARVGARAGASDHLVSEALYLRDPDGLGIEVYADRPRAEWRVMDRQIAMDTRPLDLQSLIEAAHGRAWTGMPKDTQMGHVHLHVGDLERAADFYHARLGLDKVVWSYPGALFLSAGGYHHHLGLNTWAGSSATPPTEQDARLLTWRIEVPDRAVSDAARASVALTGARIDDTRGGWSAADPWGTTLELTSEAR